MQHRFGLSRNRHTLSTAGVGVGDTSASPTASLLFSILQDGLSRIATIIFAYRVGTYIEPECKFYRLAADIMNDAAMVLDLLSPALPKPIRVIVLSVSQALRGLCGVAAGSAKASLSAHFARWGNLGELNAVSWDFELNLAKRVTDRYDSERFESRSHHFSNRDAGKIF